MAKVLGQLFATTELFDMQTRPELVLLQKSMVLVEGVRRALDPELDIWTVAEPVVGDFVRREAGPLGRLEDLKDHADVALDGDRPAARPCDAGRSGARRLRGRRAARRTAARRGMMLIGFWVLLVDCRGTCGAAVHLAFMARRPLPDALTLASRDRPSPRLAPFDGGRSKQRAYSMKLALIRRIAGALALTMGLPAVSI